MVFARVPLKANALRYLFSLQGDTLINGVVAADDT